MLFTIDCFWETDCLKLWCSLTPQASPAKLASVSILVLFNVDSCLSGIRQIFPNPFHSHSSQSSGRLYSLICGFSLARVNLHHCSLSRQHFPVQMGTELGFTHGKSLPLRWSPSQSGMGTFLGYIPGGAPSHSASEDLEATPTIWEQQVWKQLGTFTHVLQVYKQSRLNL